VVLEALVGVGASVHGHRHRGGILRDGRIPRGRHEVQTPVGAPRHYDHCGPGVQEAVELPLVHDAAVAEDIKHFAHPLQH